MGTCLRKFNIGSRTIFFAFLCALASSLAIYQLLQQQHLTLKLHVLFTVYTVGMTVISAVVLGWIQRKLALTKRTWFYLMGGALIWTGVLVAWFQFSFPQKEFTIPERTVTITVSGPGASSEDFVISSLQNGYRYLPLSMFAIESGWTREGETLRLNPEAGTGKLTVSERMGREVSLWIEKIPANWTLIIDWGDGSSDAVTQPIAQEGAFTAPHSYDESTLTFERLDFALNLFSIVAIIGTFWTLYFAILTSFVSRRSRSFRWVFVGLSVFLVLIRCFSMFNFPVDWDERTYSRAALRYAEKILALQFDEIPNVDYNYEHPALIKLAYSVPIVLDGHRSFERIGIPANPHAAVSGEIHVSYRAVSAFFNLLLAQFLIYLIHPLAGFYFMIHSIMAEFGSTVRLESIPALFAFLSVYCAWEALRKIEGAEDEAEAFDGSRWLLSALFLGITAAAKLIHCVVAVAIGVIWIRAMIRGPKIRGKLLRMTFVYALIVIAGFFVFNPSSYYDPIGTVKGMVEFHLNFQGNMAGHQPWYQPLVWITRSVPIAWPGNGVLNPVQENPFGFVFIADEVIFILALLGLRPMFRRNIICLLWLVFGVTFMFFWGTKGQQYAATVTVPICIAAMYGTFEFMKKLQKYNAESGNDRS